MSRWTGASVRLGERWPAAAGSPCGAYRPQNLVATLVWRGARLTRRSIPEGSSIAVGESLEPRCQRSARRCARVGAASRSAVRHGPTKTPGASSRELPHCRYASSTQTFASVNAQHPGHDPIARPAALSRQCCLRRGAKRSWSPIVVGKRPRGSGLTTGREGRWRRDRGASDAGSPSSVTQRGGGAAWSAHSYTGLP